MPKLYLNLDSIHKFIVALFFLILYSAPISASNLWSLSVKTDSVVQKAEPILQDNIERFIHSRRHFAYRIQTELYLSRELLKRLVENQIIAVHPQTHQGSSNTASAGLPKTQPPYPSSHNPLLILDFEPPHSTAFTNHVSPEWILCPVTTASTDSILSEGVQSLQWELPKHFSGREADSVTTLYLVTLQPDSAWSSYFLQDRNFIHRTGATFRSLARLHGVSVAVVWFSTELAQIAAIGLLTQAGLGEYALLAPVVPLSFVNTGLAIHIKSMRHRKKMRKGYGSRAAKRKAQKTYKQLLSSMQIRNHQSIIHFLDNPKPDSSLILSVNKQHFFSEIASALRLQKRKATRKNLVRFTKHTDPKNQEALLAIIRNKNAGKELRIIDYATKLKQSDSASFALFKDRFSGSLSVQASPPASMLSEEEQVWLGDLLWIEDMDSLPGIMKRTPQTLEIQRVYDLLMHIVLPTWADRNFKPGYRELRKSIKAINNSRYKSLGQGSRQWSEADWYIFMEEMGD